MRHEATRLTRNSARSITCNPVLINGVRTNHQSNSLSLRDRGPDIPVTNLVSLLKFSANYASRIFIIFTSSPCSRDSSTKRTLNCYVTAARVFHFSKVYLKRLRRVCKDGELFERRQIKKEKIRRRFDQINLNAV